MDKNLFCSFLYLLIYNTVEEIKILALFQLGMWAFTCGTHKGAHYIATHLSEEVS